MRIAMERAAKAMKSSLQLHARAEDVDLSSATMLVDMNQAVTLSRLIDVCNGISRIAHLKDDSHHARYINSMER